MMLLKSSMQINVSNLRSLCKLFPDQGAKYENAPEVHLVAVVEPLMIS